MKKFSKKSKIDIHGLCLNEYENNYNNAKVYFDRATGKKPEMEVSKAIANLIKKKIKNNDNNKVFLIMGMGLDIFFEYY